jgi:protease-4
MDGNLPPPNSPPPLNVPPPPPLSAPPIITPQPSSRPPKSGRGWKILALILLVLLVVSVFTNVTQFFENLFKINVGRERYAGPRLEEMLLEDNDSHNKVAILNVEGIISSEFDGSGYGMVELVKDQLKRAEEDDRVKAVVLKVNSPGGEVLASDEISRAVAEFQEDTPERHGKPVVCSMGSLAASGGYYISAPCRWIVANDLTITGSIGVLLHTWNYRGLMDKVGLRPEIYKSGKYKDMLSGERSPEEIPPEERAMVQSLIDQTYQKFKNVVAEGRAQSNKKNGKAGRSLSPDWHNYADGRVLSGTEAYQHGFVDELGNFDTAVARAEKLAGLPGPANLVEYQPRRDLAELFRLFGKTETRALKVDFGMELPKLRGGQLYYLWPTYLR